MRCRLIALVLVAACYSPQPYTSCALSCTYDSANPTAAQGCPGSFVCGNEGMCRNASDQICTTVVLPDAPVIDPRDGTLIVDGTTSTDAQGDGSIPACTYNGIAFEPFNGSNIGAYGWTMTRPFDSEVLTPVPVFVGAAFGSATWRLANTIVVDSTGGYPISPRSPSVGEDAAMQSSSGDSARHKHFRGTFQFTSLTGSATAGQQTDVTISGGSGSPLAMLIIGGTDAAHFAVSYFQLGAASGSCAAIVNTILNSAVSADTIHTVQMTLDVGEGSDDDIVTISLDNAVIGTFPSWESHYRCLSQRSITVDSLAFIPDMNAASNTGGGLLIDNLIIESCQAPFASINPAPTPPGSSAQ